MNLQIGMKFSISIHMLLCIEFFKDKYKITGNFIAASVNTNPVIIRKLILLLKEANLLGTTLGVGGIYLLKNSEEITLLDIYKAISKDDIKLLKIHQKSSKECPVGGKIEKLLEKHFFDIQDSFESELKEITLSDLISDIKSQQFE